MQYIGGAMILQGEPKFIPNPNICLVSMVVNIHFYVANWYLGAGKVTQSLSLLATS